VKRFAKEPGKLTIWDINLATFEHYHGIPVELRNVGGRIAFGREILTVTYTSSNTNTMINTPRTTPMPSQTVLSQKNEGIWNPAEKHEGAT
jgi:hypothetical protein